MARNCRDGVPAGVCELVLGWVSEEIHFELQEPKGRELPDHPEGGPLGAVVDRVIELGVAHALLALPQSDHGGKQVRGRRHHLQHSSLRLGVGRPDPEPFGHGFSRPGSTDKSIVAAI